MARRCALLPVFHSDRISTGVASERGPRGESGEPAHDPGAVSWILVGGRPLRGVLIPRRPAAVDRNLDMEPHRCPAGELGALRSGPPPARLAMGARHGGPRVLL